MMNVHALKTEGVRHLIPDLSKSLRLVSSADGLDEACLVSASYFAGQNCDLLSLFFCDVEEKLESVRPYRNVPAVLTELAKGMVNMGGCPIKREAIARLYPFNFLDIDTSKHSDFMSQRFIREIRKLEYSCVLVVPVLIGNGVGVAIVGLAADEDAVQKREECVSAVCQFLITMARRYPEVTRIYSKKRIPVLESQALLLATGGSKNWEIAELLGLTEFAVGKLFVSAARRLNAASRSHLIAIALATGEISNTQIGNDNLE